MRTLREWDKYLKEQEKAVKKSAKPKPSARIPATTAEQAEQRTETPGPKSGAIIAVPAETPARPADADPFTMPEIDDYVPAVSEPRPIPKGAEEAVSEPRPAKTSGGPPGDSVQTELLETPKKGRVPARPAASRPRKRRRSKAAPDDGSLSRRLMQMSPSVVEFFTEAGDETAEKYYSKGFRESRHQLIERLLDPPLTLEETARVLGVCPTTVRRYTNKGVLSHFRTGGNQRRFRLSDVVTFVESHLLAQKPPSEEPATKKPPAAEPSAHKVAPQKAPGRKTSAKKGPAQKTAGRRKPAKKTPSRKRTSKAGKSRR